MSRSPIISLIIPVYNIEKYLKECLDSIAAQTFTDWECILVDDGSKDGSGAICDEYAAQDSRFKVIHKQNEGVSSARNTGLDNAKCDWFAFVDSDDTIDNNYLELLYSTAVKTDSDMVVCGFVKHYGDNMTADDLSQEKSAPDTNGADMMSLTRYEFLEDFHKFRINELSINVLHSPCMRIYRKNNDFCVRFNSNIKWGEDYLFNLEYFAKLQKISFVRECMYHYRYTQGSITNSLENKFVDDALVYINETEKFFRDNLSEDKISYYYCYKRMEFRRLLNNVIKKCIFNKKNISVLDYLNERLKKELSGKVLFAKPFKVKDVLPLILFKLNLTKLVYLPIAKLVLHIKKR